MPSYLIYDDATKLDWFTEIDQKYALSGGKFYQASLHKNGNHVFKYLGGVALMQLPFVAIAHQIAPMVGQPADGFSLPYQLAVACGALLYALLGFFLLRRVLLRFFDDQTSALTLLLVGAASNLPQYVSVDSGMSHAFIFPLYAAVLWTTLKWHEKPKLFWAIATGYLIGLATISRPTEAIMLFIPLLWNTQNKAAAHQKWQQVRENPVHIVSAVLGGMLGILPQLIYWKMTAGTWIYDVGSKWYFLNPFFRVLFGWEKGWLIYTPVAIFFCLGMFRMRNQVFQRSVLVFCLLNLWIIMAWSDWTYGASYSCRALTQSYPVFALALSSFLHPLRNRKTLLYVGSALLIFLNLFQLWQYNREILHYRDMNLRYYARIFLNTRPETIDFSLLDTRDFLYNESQFVSTLLVQQDSAVLRQSGELFFEQEFPADTKTRWIRVELQLDQIKNADAGRIRCALFSGGNNALNNADFRLLRPLFEANNRNNYAFYQSIPSNIEPLRCRISLEGEQASALLTKMKVLLLRGE